MPEAARSLAAALAVLNHRAALPLVGRIAGVDAPIEPFEQLLAYGFRPLGPAGARAPHRVHPSVVPTGDLSGPLAQRAPRPPPGRRPGIRLDGEPRPPGGRGRRCRRGAGPRARGAGQRCPRPRGQGHGRSSARVGLLAEHPAGRRRAQARGCRPRLRRRRPGGQSRRARQRDRIDRGRAGPESGAGGARVGQGPHARALGAGSSGSSSPEDPEGPEARDTVARAWAELAEISIAFGQAPEAAHAAGRALALASPKTSSERLAQLHGALAEGYQHGAASGLARLRLRLPEAPEQVSGDEVDLLVIRATLAMFAGLTTAAVADLRARAGTGPGRPCAGGARPLPSGTGHPPRDQGRVRRSARASTYRPDHRRRRSTGHRGCGMPCGARHPPCLPG